MVFLIFNNIAVITKKNILLKIDLFLFKKDIFIFLQFFIINLIPYYNKSDVIKIDIYRNKFNINFISNCLILLSYYNNFLFNFFFFKKVNLILFFNFKSTILINFFLRLILFNI